MTPREQPQFLEQQVSYCEEKDRVLAYQPFHVTGLGPAGTRRPADERRDPFARPDARQEVHMRHMGTYQARLAHSSGALRPWEYGIHMQ